MGVSGVSTATKITSEYVAPEVKNETKALGKDDFLTLLVAQMKYQDPLNPTDNTESIAQLAQFSSLEQMENLNTTMESLVSYQKSLTSLNGAQFVGKQIDFSEIQSIDTKDEATGDTVKKDTQVTVNGTVTSVKYEDGEPIFTVTDSKGEIHTTNMANIKSVTDASATNYTTNTKLNTVISGAAMVGREVEGKYQPKDASGANVGDPIEISGTVKSVSFSGNSPTLKIIDKDGNDYTIKMEDVLSVV